MKKLEIWDLNYLALIISCRRVEARGSEKSESLFVPGWRTLGSLILIRSLLPIFFTPGISPGPALSSHLLDRFSGYLVSKQSSHCNTDCRGSEETMPWKPVKTEVEVNRWKLNVVFLFLKNPHPRRFSLIFRERGKGRERERGRDRDRQTDIDVKEKHQLVTSHMHSNQGSNLQPRDVPWLAI